MKRPFKLLILILICAVIALPIFFILYKQIITPYINTPNEYYKTHILGGFSIDTPENAVKAATDDVQVAFQYGGHVPSENDSFGQKLRLLQMKVVDAAISGYLAGYECYRVKIMKSDLFAPVPFCQYYYPYLPDQNALLSAIATHLRQVKDNQLIIGYWVLDDWVPWDAGSARQLLIKIHDLIQHYTPDRPAICGFSGDITSDHTTGWSDWVADNFSPQGCDRVGFYIYAPTVSNATPISSLDAYDWSMSTLLPAMFASLQKRGWDITKEPLIGIAQAFGGPVAHTNSHWVTPTAKDIEVQSKSFCEHGATGLAFYAWNDIEFGPITQTPINSTQIEAGIRKGIAACRQYWRNHPNGIYQH